MYICDKNECTGCMACLNICPVKAISVGEDKHGFYIPNIDSTKCINCQQCKKICPNIVSIAKESIIPKVYAAWTKNQELREHSTSGGIFTGVAEWIINNGGCVYGAAFDKNNKVRHIGVNSFEELEQLRGSKYVQSYIGGIYLEIKAKLKDGRLVLFTGTPCQIAGLYSFLGKSYENLFTMDIVCHGVPSPKAFRDYINYMSEKEHSNIKEISFRKKEPSWTIFSMYLKYSNNNIYKADIYHDPYLIAFLCDYISRDCCYNCHYTTEERMGDITVADFWSYVSYSRKVKNDEKGISLVIINTKKGINIFESIKEQYIISERTMSEAKRGNRCLSRPYEKALKSDKFWYDYDNGLGFIECTKKYCSIRKKNLKHSVSETLNRNYYLLPKLWKKTFNYYLKKKL